MDQQLCHKRFHEALRKAFAARAASVRMAYFDLASYYQAQIADEPDLLVSRIGLRESEFAS